MYSNQLAPHRVRTIQWSSTLAEIEFRMAGGNLTILTAYVPHDQTNQQEDRSKAWAELDERLAQIPPFKNVVVLGDLNAALHARKQ